MKYIVSGGGTGGHIYPALAIAQGIRDRQPDAKILYVGSQNGMESRIVPSQGWEYAAVDISGIDRSSMLKASQSLVKFPKSMFQGWDIVKTFKPDVVVGTGGYASFPVVLASTFYSCRSYIHEQNAVLGLANRNLAKRVNAILLTFEEAGHNLGAQQVMVTGLPVRKSIITVKRNEAMARFGFKSGLFTLVAFGGSQGAMSINNAMLGLLERVQEQDMQVIWITGEQHFESMQEEMARRFASGPGHIRLQVLSYLDHMEDALAVADIAVCRAGAGTLSELAILGLPAVLIPYPYASENHQEHNARALVAKNAAAMIIDEFLDGDTLYKKLTDLRQEAKILKDMASHMKKEAKPRALDDILDIIL